jgi:hypothetical protein
VLSPDRADETAVAVIGKPVAAMVSSAPMTPVTTLFDTEYKV